MNGLRKFRKSVMFGLKLMMTLAMALGFIHVWYNDYSETIYSQMGNYVVLLSYFTLFILFAELYGGFKIGIYRLHEIVYSLSLSALFTNFLMYLELCLIARRMLNPTAYFLGFLYQLFVILMGSKCANTAYFRLYPARHTLAIFADDDEGKAIIRKMSRIPDRFAVERGVSIRRAPMEQIKELIDRYEAILLCDFDKDIKNELLHYCYARGKRTYILPSSTDVIIRNSDQIQIFDTPILMCSNRGLRLEQELIKRVCDIVVSAVGIVVLSPLMLIVALSIKLCDGGPILFKQNRVTKNGKIFNVYKFRSMIVDAEKEGAQKATDHDNRITPVGRVIRACRMDELPQLFNILFGDMSLVGPRPERIENVYEYTQKYPDFALRHRVKAGLTGYAQIYGKYNTSPEDKLKMDLIYIEQYSIFLDLKLLFMTVKILFMKESTEGFSKKESGAKTKEEHHE